MEKKEINITEILKDIDIKEFELKYINKVTFYFGTDKYGRDMLSRMITGSRVSISIGFVAFIQLMMILLIYKILHAYTKEDFSKLSSLSKFIMVLGILTIPLFYMPYIL